MADFSRFGLGTYENTDASQCAQSVATAIDIGYRHIDTAQGYDNEKDVGKGLRESSVDADDLFVATKLDTGNLGHDDVIATTEASVNRLGIDAIDLLYVHWPLNTYDPEETLPALDELYEGGLIRNVGLSNFRPDQLDEAIDRLDAPLFAHQIEMHPLLQQEELRAYAEEDDHWLVAYCPVARGEVVGVDQIDAVAEKHDATPYQISLAWLLAKDNVAPIPKATSEEHIRENYEALDIELDEEDVEQIDGIEREERLVDFDEAPWNE